ncbi:MAG: hypothetical protein JNL70_06070 [Saprospiraceae bacterium]|nr:hypothetical protein [Saprospiraceae bacterium]
MNKLIIITSALIFLVSCQKYTFKKEQRLHEQGKIHCGWYGKKTVDECRKIYPFNEAAKIVLVSFPDYEIWENDIRTYTDTIVSPEGEKLERKRNLMGKDIPVKITRPILDTIKVLGKVYSVYEKLELNETQIDSLSYFCENYTTNYRLIHGSRSISCCYRPRNAIVFFDKQNKPIMNFEICFECGQYRCYTPDNLGYLSQIDECPELYDLFKDFFRKNGIHYGIDSLSTGKN